MAGNARRAFLGRAATASAMVGMSGAAALAATQRSGRRSRKAPAGGRRVIRGSTKSPFSQATIFSGVVFCSGVVGRKPGPNPAIPEKFEVECKQAMDNLKGAVEAAGAQMGNVLKCTVFLTDVSDFTTFNGIFRTYFPKDPPARSTVVVKELVVPGARLEIDCVACVE